MKANRDNVVGRMRNIQVDWREMVENEIREMVRLCILCSLYFLLLYTDGVKDEAAAWRGGRRCLSFGYSSEDIEDALKDVEDNIENELLAEMYGIDFNYEDDLLGLQTRVGCPMCKEDRLEDRQAYGMIRCNGRECGLALVCMGGLDIMIGGPGGGEARGALWGGAAV
jgi:hypothetical protein